MGWLRQEQLTKAILPFIGGKYKGKKNYHYLSNIKVRQLSLFVTQYMLRCCIKSVANAQQLLTQKSVFTMVVKYVMETVEALF